MARLRTADPVAAARTAPTIEVVGAVKRFGGITALRGVSLSIRPGTVHALVGENGAGKSTLGSVLGGIVTLDGGCVRFDGEEVRWRSPREAIAAGVSVIGQELALVPHASVVENVFLGQESRRLGVVDRAATRRRFARLCSEVGFSVPANALVRDLRTADQQKVEILRAVARRCRVIVMDEPTAALNEHDSRVLTDMARDLAAKGTTVIFVSHFLREVLAVADDVTVLRDGAIAGGGPASELTEQDLVQLMLGRRLDLAFPERTVSTEAPVVLSVRNLSRPGALRDVSFDVRRGEIVGLAGLVGSGRSEVAHAIFGADSIAGGEMLLDGRPLSPRTTRDAVRAGIALVPEDRKHQGLVMGRSVADNLTLAHLGHVSHGGLVTAGAQRARVEEARRSMALKAPDALAPVSTLSGGNQQKVLFAKWLLRRPKVLIVDEPTRGVDVGAKVAIYELIADLARQGTAVLVISSELEEVLGLAHRVLVMRGGAISGEFEPQRKDAEEAILHAAFAIDYDNEAA